MTKEEKFLKKWAEQFGFKFCFYPLRGSSTYFLDRKNSFIYLELDMIGQSILGTVGQRFPSKSSQALQGRINELPTFVEILYSKLQQIPVVELPKHPVYDLYDPVIFSWAEKRHLHVTFDYKDEYARIVNFKSGWMSFWSNDSVDVGSINITVLHEGKTTNHFCPTPGDFFNLAEKAVQDFIPVGTGAR